MTLNACEAKILDLTTRIVMKEVQKVPGHVLGHGYLWGHVTFNRRLKNGKLKVFTVKHLFGGICAADFNEVVRIAEAVPGVSRCHINID